MSEQIQLYRCTLCGHTDVYPDQCINCIDMLIIGDMLDGSIDGHFDFF